MESRIFKPSKINCDQVKENAELVNSNMCIFIQGSDNFQRDRALNEILKILKYTINDEMNSFLYYGDLFSDKVKIGEIIDTLNMYSFNLSPRLITIRNFEFLKKDAIARISKYIDDPCPHSRLIIDCFSSDFKDRTFDTLTKKCLHIQSQEVVWQKDKIKWLDILLAENDLKMDERTKALFIEKIEFDIYNVDNELKKLKLYINGQNLVTINDVTKCTLNTRVYTMFELLESVGFKRKTEVFYIIENLIDNDTSIILIIYKLCDYFYNLLKIDAQTRNGKTITDILLESKEITPNTHEYRKKIIIEKYTTYLKNYNRAKILNALKQLYICDSRAKLTLASEKVLLANMVYNILR